MIAGRSLNVAETEKKHECIEESIRHVIDRWQSGLRVSIRHLKNTLYLIYNTIAVLRQFGHYIAFWTCNNNKKVHNDLRCNFNERNSVIVPKRTITRYHSPRYAGVDPKSDWMNRKCKNCKIGNALATAGEMAFNFQFSFTSVSFAIILYSFILELFSA